MNLVGISSPICKVHWAGWESNTHALQRCGWQISAEQDLAYRGIRIALKHPNFRIYGISEMVDWGTFQDAGFQMFERFPIPIKYMASRMDIILHDNLSSFQPIDAVPKIQERKSIEDFMIFRPIAKVNEIIIAEQTVPELLDIILSKQAPLQAELREKRRKEWRKFTRKVNEGALIQYEKIEDNRDQIIAQLITV